MLGNLPNLEIKPLIIFGAGASHDLTDSRGDFFSSRLRPPLVEDIFANNFENIQRNFRLIDGLVGTITNRLASNEKSMEDILDEIQDKERKLFSKEIDVLKLYLRRLFFDISEENYKITGNNYSTFFRNIDAVCPEYMVVNFNYDYLAQKALEDGLRFRFDDFDAYINNKIKLIHPHGSVLWGEINGKLMVERRITGDPVIVIPTTGKIAGKEFVCPDSHIEKLCLYLEKANVVIIIGWRGNEAHFSDLLPGLKDIRRIIIVGGKNPGAVLKNSGLSRFKTCEKIRFEGFSNFLKKYSDFKMVPDTEDYF